MASSLLLPANELMVQYARYHRDRRNIATHMVGVPMIVFGVGVLLARAHVGPGDPGLTLAWVAWALATLWYISRGHLLLGLAVSAVNAVLFGLAVDQEQRRMVGMRWLDRVALERAEPFGKCDVLGGSERLVAEDQQLVVHQLFVHPSEEVGVASGLGEVDVEDLGTDRRGERLDRRSSCHLSVLLWTMGPVR